MSLWGWQYIDPEPAAPQVPPAPAPVIDPRLRPTTDPQPQLNPIHLRREFEQLLDFTVGSWHVVRRFNREQKCTCRNRRDGSDEPDRACRFCKGHGWPFFEFPVKLYSYNQAIYASMTASKFQATFGVMAEQGKIFVAPVWSKPQTNDQIYQVELTASELVQLPLRRLARYRVAQAIDLRADRFGAIEYFMVYATEEETIGD